MISTRMFLGIVVLVISVVNATRPFFEHAQELNLNGVSDRVDVSDDFNTLQGGEMTFAFRATQKSIERNYERAWDWSRSCGSAHVFVDVYTSLHMTFQVYGLGHVAVDNFWELGVEHVYAFVVSNTHMKVYRDGIEMGARAVNGGIGHGVRDQFYIGGSACDSIQRWHANVKWFRVWTEALPEKMIKDLNIPEKTPCTLAETTFTIDETIDGNSGAMSYFAVVNVPGPSYVFRQNPGTCSYKELHFGVNPITKKLYVGMCGVGTSETVAALPDGVNAIAMKYHAYGELEIWANGAKLDLGISQINGRAFSSSSVFQSSCSDQIKVYNRALSQHELATMTALTSVTNVLAPSGAHDVFCDGARGMKELARFPDLGSCYNAAKVDSDCDIIHGVAYAVQANDPTDTWRADRCTCVRKTCNGPWHATDRIFARYGDPFLGTQTPTMQPSSMPTVNPTSSPSVNPTSSPSVNPSSSPSVNPSSNPSFNPSSSPTSTPTTNPSKRPTAEDFIVKVKAFHGEPKDVLDASKLQDQPDVDAEFFGFEHKLTPFTRRLLNRFYDVGEQGFGREEQEFA